MIQTALRKGATFETLAGCLGRNVVHGRKK